MQIQITPATNWQRVLNAARWTMNLPALTTVFSVSPLAPPSDKFKYSILMAQHSPIRLLEYDIQITGIPYCNAVHFVRHHIGIEKFQCTLRSDRNKLVTDRNQLPQDTPVNLWIAANAEAIINISQKRLCNQADKTTRHIWQQVHQAFQQQDPILAQFMVPTCIYRGFCPEIHPCGYTNTQHYTTSLQNYRSLHSNNPK